MKFVRFVVLSMLVSSALFGQQMPPAKAPDRPVLVRPAIAREILSGPLAATARN